MVVKIKALTKLLWLQLVFSLLGASFALADKANNEQLKFAIYEFDVRGNSVIEPSTVEKTLYPFLGTSKTIEDVESARQALEQLYREKGYPAVIVTIPEQNATRGAISLEVTESKIVSLEVTGSDYFSPKDIRNQVPALKEGAILNSQAVGQQLGKLNASNPDRSIVPILKPGKFPGTVDVELKVADRIPAHTSISFDNRYSANTTHQRASVDLRYANLWQANHSVDLRYQWSPQDPREVKVLVGTYVLPVGEQNDKVALYAVDSKSNVAPSGVLSVLGNGNIWGARYIKPLDSSASFYHSFTLGADYKDFKDVINVFRESGLETPISYLQLMVQYNANWAGPIDEAAQKNSHLTSWTLSFNSGERGLMNDVDEFQDKADGAKPSYFYVRNSIEHNHLLPWELSMNAKAELQESRQVLVSNEQYGIGGAESVRGYLESEEMGENGQNAQLELRSMPFVKEEFHGLDGGYAFIFKDWGHVKVENPLGDQYKQITLSSFGIGLTASFYKTLMLSAAWAHPEKNSTHVEAGKNRIHFSVVLEF